MLQGAMGPSATPKAQAQDDFRAKVQWGHKKKYNKKKKAQLPKEKKSTQAQEEEETYAVTRQPQELKHTWLHHRQVEVIAFYQPRKCRGLTFCQQILLYCSGALNILNNVKCTSNCNKT